jgi:SAM-dependent methyltransferase
MTRESNSVRELINAGKATLISFSKRKIQNFGGTKKYFLNKTGLEIGGPSDLFGKNGHIPFYEIANRIDGCNFSTNTVWENAITEGPNYKYQNYTLGYQYIKDAIDLAGIASEKYDFVLSSHSLEHIANPLKAIEEWIRVLKNGGALFIVVPDKHYIFDHKRPYTTFEHLLYATTEHDLTHLDEILDLHDLERDLPAGNVLQFKKRSLDNFSNRCLHHHVFDIKLMEEIFRYFNLSIVFIKPAMSIHLIAMGIKIIKN